MFSFHRFRVCLALIVLLGSGLLAVVVSAPGLLGPLVALGLIAPALTSGLLALEVASGLMALALA